MNDAEVVSKVLERALAEGGLNRIPRHPDHREVILAILCLGMRRRYPYTELEFNEFLQGALAELRARVDHVTCRRSMVDFGFVKRDRAGNRYFLNFPKLESALSDDAIASARDLVEKVLASPRVSSRGRRKRPLVVGEARRRGNQSSVE
jgi:hypothetical protein